MIGYRSKAAVLLVFPLVCVTLGAKDSPVNVAKSTKSTGKSIYDFTVKNIDGQDVALAKYRESVLLIVNVASR